jgi:hypothetical protein
MPDADLVRRPSPTSNQKAEGDDTSAALPLEPTSSGRAGESSSSKPAGHYAGSVASAEISAMSSMRVNWQLKTIWPVAVVLLVGMLLFLLSTLSLKGTERHRVLVIAGAGRSRSAAYSLWPWHPQFSGP